MSGIGVAIVLPPWLADASERDALVRAGRALRADADVIDCEGRGSPVAVAAAVAPALGEGGRRLVIFPAGPEGEAAAALLAARTGGCTLGRCARIAVEADAIAGRRAVFGGRAELLLRSESAITCATLRPDASAGAGTPYSARRVTVDEAPPETEAVPAAASLPRVEGAAVVVSGGRGVNAPEGFALLARIASALGGGLGGSLPAVDAGLVPVAHQVGQSGKFVSPRLYFAVGISGTPQHLAGIAEGTRIVALNADRDAPIFARSALGAQGDWREILPLLAGELERAAR